MSQTVIIGGATTATFPGTDCVVSAQWGFNPGRQDAYCLGEWLPNDTYTIYKATQTLSMTIYAAGDSYDISPSEACEIAGNVSASVAPQSCGGTMGGVSGSWQVTGYSYTKDNIAQPGQESWSMTKWIGVTGAPTGNIEPTYILRGVSQGSSDGDTGIVFSGTTVDASSGSVAAGSLGKGNTMEYGQVSSVGGGAGGGSVLGTGNVSIPYTPLYI